MSVKNILNTLLNSTWSISQEAAIAYAPLVESYLSGNLTALGELKNQESEILVSIPEGIDIGDDKIVAVLPIKGVITRHDFCGEMGTETMDALLKRMIADESISAIILDINTPGGEASYLENLSETIANGNQVKPIVTYLSGMCCSGGYYAASRSQSIFASAKSDVIGSIGTMIQIRKSSASNENTIVSIKATKSTDKNKMYEEAQKGNYDLIRTQMLDPINEIFHETVKAGRPNLNESVLTGATYYSREAESLGLIDGVKSFEQVIEYAIELTKNTSDMKMPNFLSNLKKPKMKKLEKVSAILGRDVAEGETLTAEETQKVMAALETPVENSEEVTASKPVSAEDIKAIVNAAIQPLSTQLGAIDARVVNVEASKGANPTIATPTAAADANANVPAWEDPKNPVNQALDAALAERGLK